MPRDRLSLSAVERVGLPEVKEPKISCGGSLAE